MLSASFALFMYSVNICIFCVRGDSKTIYFNVGGAGGKNLDVSENDGCNRTNGILWTCQKLKNCPEALDRVRTGDHPFLCGFEEKEPIVCCKLAVTRNGSSNGISGDGSPFGRESQGDSPLVTISEPLTEAKSSAMCEKYSRTLCLNNSLDRAPTYWSQNTTIPPNAILGGADSNPKEFPHMAMIGYGDGPDNISWRCGGTLISENFVLSAAHCTFPGSTIGLAKYVRMGDLNTENDVGDIRPQQFEIYERIDHPDYRPHLLYNDIALYRLDRNARLDDYVRPVCLYRSYSLPEETGVVTGWGRTEFAGPLSKDLQKANLTYIDSVRCSQLLKISRQLPRGIDALSMVCAGESDGSKDTCQGDSGGPLAMQKHLQRTCLASQVGIVSFGRQCGLPNSPGVYTRVAHFIPWIEAIVWPGPI